MIADRAAFIRANTRLMPVPHAPEIRLHLADEATQLWQKTSKHSRQRCFAFSSWNLTPQP